MSKLHELIAQQQKGHEDKPRFAIGEQLKEIAEREPKSAELIEQDLQIKEMTLEAAEKAFRNYADKHKSGKVFCITPSVAEEILRKFYGLPNKDEVKTEPNPAQENYIDLSSFL